MFNRHQIDIKCILAKLFNLSSFKPSCLTHSLRSRSVTPGWRSWSSRLSLRAQSPPRAARSCDRIVAVSRRQPCPRPMPCRLAVASRAMQSAHSVARSGTREPRPHPGRAWGSGGSSSSRGTLVCTLLIGRSGRGC